MLIYKVLLVSAIALEFVFVPLFLKAMWPQKTKKSLALKMVCTALFISVGFLAVKISGNTTAFGLAAGGGEGGRASGKRGGNGGSGGGGGIAWGGYNGNNGGAQSGYTGGARRLVTP